MVIISSISPMIGFHFRNGYRLVPITVSQFLTPLEFLDYPNGDLTNAGTTAELRECRDSFSLGASLSTEIVDRGGFWGVIVIRITRD